jgi:hypothetical protein
MAITEGAVIAVNGADASSTGYTSGTFDSTGGGGILYFLVHEGASTASYTWTDNKSTPGGQFVTLGTMNASTGTGSGDLNITLMFVYRGSATWGTGHTVTVDFAGADARTFRYGGGVVLNGTFGSTHVSATTQTAQGSNGTVDAGSLVTDAAAYCIQVAGNYNAEVADSAGTGWTLKSNATGGRHFSARNESSAGTFDPVINKIDSSHTWITIAAAIKETSSTTLTQEGFRFRNDDGSESAATWLAAQDTNITQPVNTNTRLRVLLDASGDPAAGTYQLEWQKVSEGVWRKVR